MTHRIRAAILATTAVLLTACASNAGQVTPNGAVDKPVTITATSYNVTGRSGGDQLVKFTELVGVLSNGSITITTGPEPDSGKPDTSAEAIAMAQDGRAQLAIVSARTFDTLGVTSFQALQAPYLVTSNELADKVLSDPVANTMLDGTKSLGLVGLGLAYDFLAYPGGFGQPVLTPADYAGKAFQVRPSRASDLLVQSLGGISDPRNGPDLSKAVAEKEVWGSWEKFDGPTQPVGGEIFTANEPAFLRANVIVMNEKVFAGLSPAQQQSLRDAAAQTRDWMATRHKDPATLAAAYCSDGNGSIVIATPNQMAAMKAATAPVVAAMEQEKVTRTVIAHIRELAQGVTAPPAPTPCRAADTSVLVARLAPSGDQTAINGVWRLEVEQQVLADGGASQMDVINNFGSWTWTFSNGRVTYVKAGEDACAGTFVLHGDRIQIIGEADPCNIVFSFTFARSGKTMRMKPTPGQVSGLLLTDDTDLRVVPDDEAFWVAYFRNALVRLGETS